MLRVAIQGIKGSYSAAAAEKLLVPDAEIVHCENFTAVFRSLEGGEADQAVLPVKNRIVSDITPVTEWIADAKPQIIARIRLEINHVLAAVQEAEFAEITLVFSHPEALKQCGKFLLRNPHLASVAANDTASSVRKIMSDGLPTKAAICSEEAAALYGAKVISDDIADEKENWTEFCLMELEKNK